jgi:phage terminase large subunit-like protein
MTTLDGTTLKRWKNDPTSFVTEVLHDPETKRPFQLLPAEYQFMQFAFMLDDNGRLLYPEQVFSAPKKSGKSTLAALVTLTMVLLRSEGRGAEAIVVANSFDQAQSRVFTMCRRIVEASPLLRTEAKIGVDRIVIPALDASIVALASDAASAAGSNPTVSVCDEAGPSPPRKRAGCSTSWCRRLRARSLAG